MSVTLYQGDCLHELGRVADASVDACVTDPPYELNFMGREWDRSGIANNVALWREVYRVLKPGGHVLAFGGTRTYHRMVCAIEDAGFEIRDSLDWLYGSGFPKSLDVGKALDRAAGAFHSRNSGKYRSNAGLSKTMGGRVQQGAGVGSWQRDARGELEADPHTPATALAAQWAGWGTALKPSHEPIVLARKPLSGTVAANVTAWGTGAINVDGCRVEGVPRNPGFVNPAESTRPMMATSNTRLVGYESPAGRWPPNVLLTHHPDCVQEGTRTIKSNDQRPSTTTMPDQAVYGAGLNQQRSGGYGTETVPAWRCVPGCPVAVLDGQSGERPTGGPGVTRRNTNSVAYSGPASSQDRATVGYADTGGASRFYPTFAYTAADFAPFRYVPKASRSERTHNGRIPNTHPTVKPRALIEWLIRLVTPPGGVVCDPFMGSGTTAVCAVAGGWDFIGCEQDEASFLTAVERIAHTVQQIRPAQLPLDAAS